MAAKQIPLFCTHEDVVRLLRTVSKSSALDIFQMGMFEDSTPRKLASEVEVHPFSGYMIFVLGSNVQARSVSQKDGGTKFIFDPMLNPAAVVFRFGGNKDSEKLISSDISSATNNQDGDEIYRVFLKEIKSSFKKIRSFYVGSEALRLLDSGTRLMPTEKSPVEYDLKR